MSAETIDSVETVIVHPITGLKEKFTAPSHEEVNSLISARFGD